MFFTRLISRVLPFPEGWQLLDKSIISVAFPDAGRCWQCSSASHRTEHINLFIYLYLYFNRLNILILLSVAVFVLMHVCIQIILSLYLYLHIYIESENGQRTAFRSQYPFSPGIGRISCYGTMILVQLTHELHLLPLPSILSTKKF